MLFVLCFGCLTTSVLAGELKLPYYSAHPQAADYSGVYKQFFPNGQPAKIIAPDELDVRSCDISSWDLKEYTVQELADVITFDSKTKFPPEEKLPRGFSPKKILAHGTNPGLNVRALHKQGITGEGVSIAVIDKELLLNHEDYASRVGYYEELTSSPSPEADMHAGAVVSIAVGRKAGVAPKARVFEFNAAFEKAPSGEFDARPMVVALRRIAEINTQLPAEQKIRVVSISRGFEKHDVGADEFEAAQNALEKDGVAVFTTNDTWTLSRNHTLDNPDYIANYCRPAFWWKKVDARFWPVILKNATVPTDFRVIASPTGKNDYVHYAKGGLSWAVPYVAGLYALGVQVYPQLTKEIFMQAVRKTSTTRNCAFQGEAFSHPLVSPVDLINYLKTLNTK